MTQPASYIGPKIVVLGRFEGSHISLRGSPFRPKTVYTIAHALTRWTEADQAQITRVRRIIWIAR